MTAPVEQVRFALRRRTSAAWATLNEVLKKGEPGIEIDTGFGKTGDGSTAWNSLLYTFDGHTDLTGLADGKTKLWDDTAKRWKIGDAGKKYLPGTGIEIPDPDSPTPTINSTLGSIVVDGWASIYAALPTPPPAGKITYGVVADGLIYGWNGSAWPASGTGVSLVAKKDPYSYATTALTQAATTGFLDIAQPGRWTQVGIVLDPITGFTFSSGSYLYMWAPQLIGLGDFTIEVVFTATSVADIHEIFSWTNAQLGTAGSIFPLFLEIVSGGKLRFVLRNNTTLNVDVTSAGVLVSTNVEYYLAVTVSGTAYAVYLNGVIVMSGSLTGARGTTLQNLRLGQLNDTSNVRQFLGRIRAFRVTSGVARPITASPGLPWTFV